MIADLEQQCTDAQAQREARVLKRQRAEAARQAMGWTLPATASAMVGLVDQAKAALLADAATSSYQLQAAIAALHAGARRAEDTDWKQIAALYAGLRHEHPGAVVELNAAAALAMAEGPEEGLRRIALIEAGGELAGYHLLPAARADLLRRLGRRDEAGQAYEAAIVLTRNRAEKLYLERRWRECRAGQRASD